MSFTKLKGGNLVPNILIGMGGFILLIYVVVTLSFNSIIKSAVPMALSSLTLNQTLPVWIGVPIPLALKASLTSASTSTLISNNTLAKGKLGFQIELQMWSDDPDDSMFAPIWLEENGEIDEVVRVVQVLSDGPFNYAKRNAWIFGLLFISVSVYTARQLFKKGTK